jgi:pimeloyl-ACP methyl ester carboxylesterase
MSSKRKSRSPLRPIKSPDREVFFGADGKRIYFQEWGENHKPVILLFHGFPGCADHGKLMTMTTYLERFRLISFDRPGYGRSDFQKGLTPLTLAEQIKSFLDYLNIDSLSILSVSGGAPFAMATAVVMKDRVQKLTSIAGVAPLTLRNSRYMSSMQRKAWLLRNLVPNSMLQYGAKKVWQAGVSKMDQLFFADIDSFSAPDQIVFKHPVIGKELLELTKHSLRQGPESVLADLKTYSKAWGFPLSEVNCPVTLWHGDQDDVVHYRYAQEMSRKLPRANLKFIEGEGHYSLPLNCRDEIIEDLLTI